MDGFEENKYEEYEYSTEGSSGKNVPGTLSMIFGLVNVGYIVLIPVVVIIYTIIGLIPYIGPIIVSLLGTVVGLALGGMLIAGLILGIVGLSKAKKEGLPKGQALTGTIICAILLGLQIVGFIVGIIVAILVGAGVVALGSLGMIGTFITDILYQMDNSFFLIATLF